MIDRLFTQCMISPSDLQPHYQGTKIVGTFNPGVTPTPDGITLLVRVCEAPLETRAGFHPSPRINTTGELVIDWFSEDEYDTSDPRVLYRRSDGIGRLRFISYLRTFHSRDGKTIDDFNNGPVIEPTGIYETYGIEDPRITRIENTYHITYVAVSPHGVNTSLLSTTDFKSYKRHGVIFCPENKDVVIFPRKVLGKYMAMHRPAPSLRFVPPEMWVAHSPDMIHWGRHTQLVGAESKWQNNRVGGGTPPLDTRDGFLTIYHAAQKDQQTEGIGVYTAGALLLDHDNPARVVAQTEGPILQPEADFEQVGFVNNVIFPTAMIERDDELWIYYGAADERVGVTALKRENVFNALRPLANGKV